MFHRPLRMSLRIMLAVPTIVYALMGALYLVPAVRGFTGASGYSFLAVTLTLSVMLVPFLMKQCEGLFQAALLHQNSAASNSGFSVLQTFLWVIFPQCRTGFLALVFLGFCRSLGDTMIALIVSGNTPVLVEGWLSPFRNLTAHIALMAPTDAYSLMYASSFVSLGLLLAFSVTISSVAYVLIFKNKRWLW
ncbi:MAG: ABC transporter permease subunit [Deltaproteobacteria bacterium]|nr:ABC transporter permease subunit [Deltaproteobacteria bacterium]